MLSALAVLALCVAPSIAISLPPPSFSLNPNFTDPLALDRQTLYPFGDFQSGKDSLTSVTPKLFRRDLYRRDKPTTDNLVVSWAKSNVSSASHADHLLFASRIATSELLDLLNGAVDSSGKDHVPGDTTNYFHYNTSSWVYSILVPNTTIEYRAIRAISKILLSHVNTTTTQTLTFAANLLSNDKAIADITFLPSTFPSEPLNTTDKPSVAQNDRGEVNIQTFLQHGIYNDTEPYNSSQSLITYLSNATNHDKRNVLQARFSPADTQLTLWQTQIGGLSMYLTYRNFRDGRGYLRRTFTKYYLEALSMALTNLWERISWAEKLGVPSEEIYMEKVDSGYVPLGTNTQIVFRMSINAGLIFPDNVYGISAEFFNYWMSELYQSYDEMVRKFPNLETTSLEGEIKWLVNGVAHTIGSWELITDSISNRISDAAGLVRTNAP